ncbi:MAG TPA: recombinase RecF [Clostridiales bacterium]|nr:recombinase RecF [Clostridiales bacterium]
MKIQLKTMDLQNFKGIKKLHIDFSHNTDIYGANATGKTTLFDAFTWLLFDKDSSNKKDFNIKTLDKSGEAYHGLEHSVSATLIVDGRPIDLKKTLTEKWVKQRGSVDRTFQGHETVYIVNEVPVKKTEYEGKITSIIDENVFKLITNPLYFNTALKWQDRRAVLLKIVGDISDLDVINSKEELAKLATLMQDRTLDEVRAMLKSKKSKINEELKTIPIRIDELSNSLPTLDTDIDYIGLEQEKNDLNIILQNLENDLADHRKLAQSIIDNFKSKQTDINNKRTQLSKLENDITKNALTELSNLRTTRYEASNELSNHNNFIDRTRREMDEAIVDSYDLDEKITALRTEYSEEVKKNYEDNSVFESPNREEFICPTCKQQLQVNDINMKIAEMEENFNNEKQRKIDQFNTNKKSKLDSINRKGKSYKETKEKLDAKILELDGQIQQRLVTVRDLEEKIKRLDVKIEEEAQRTKNIDFNTSVEYVNLKNTIAELENSFKKVDVDEDAQQDLINKKRNTVARIEEINTIINNKTVIENTNKRIEELEARQVVLADELTQLEGDEYLTETFIRTKVDMLESKINSKFKTVNFKMFFEQINGALVECCDTMIKGVPYSDANNAAKINSGIDIINTLTEFYQVSAPIFADNAESVNQLLDTDSQVIRLIVSEDTQLRVEVL